MTTVSASLRLRPTPTGTENLNDLWFMGTKWSMELALVRPKNCPTTCPRHLGQTVAMKSRETRYGVLG